MTRLVLLLACMAGSSVAMDAQPMPTVDTKPYVEPQAVALLNRAMDRLRAANTLRAVVKTVSKEDTVVITKYDTLELTRTGSLSIRTHVRGTNNYTLSRRTIVTPTTCWSIEGKTAQKCVPERIFQARMETVASIVRAFGRLRAGRLLDMAEWDSAWVQDPLLRWIAYVGRKDCPEQGTCEIAEWGYELAHTHPIVAMTYVTRAYIDSTGIIRHLVTTATRGFRQTEALESLTIDPPLSPSDFAWTPPEGVRVKEISTPRTFPSMLGKTFPPLDTTAHLLDGPRVAMKDVLGKKATIVYSWAPGCYSCTFKAPHLERLYREFRAQGLNVIGVDFAPEPNSEEKDAARATRTFRRATVPVLFGAFAWWTLLPLDRIIVFDRHGVVVYDGPYNFIALRATVVKLVAEP